MDGNICRKRFNCFCYLCGKFTVVQAQHKITTQLERIYRSYYRMAVMRNVWWAPAFMCGTCTRALRKWDRKECASMAYAIPMIWSNPGDHHQAENCYLCSNDIGVYGMNRKNKAHIIYTSACSAICPVLHDDNLPPPIHPAVLDPNYVDITKEIERIKRTSRSNE